ncbi:MAG: tetratricopeptide repeat protein, partial [Myxococcota bacterium]
SVGSWHDLAKVYAAQAAVVTDPAAKTSALRELARLQETRALGSEVADTYRAMLALHPTDSGALEALERVALTTGDRRTLSQVDLRLSQQAEAAPTRASYLTRLAESLEVAGDYEGALQALRDALQAEPDNVGATRNFARVANELDDPNAVADAARREASQTQSPEKAAKLLVRGAKVRIERLDDRGGAQEDLERALELDPDDPEAASLLTRMLRQKKEIPRLGDLLARAAGSAKSGERIASLWMQVADLQADELSNLPGAISSLNRVLRVAPNHISTLRRLATLYERDGQWAEAVSLLTKVVKLAPDKQVLRDAHLDLARIQQDRLDEPARALTSLQAVLSIDADNSQALNRLSRLQESEGKVGPARETVERLVRVAKSDTDRADALVRMAHLEDHAQNEDAAQTALLAALALQGPGSESALELKSRINSPTGWDRYARALGEFLSRATPRGEDAAPVYLELARVQQDHLQRADTAIELLRAGIDQGVSPLTLRVDLCARLRGARRYEEAIDELRVLLDEDITRVDTYRDLARCFDALRARNETRLSVMPLQVLGAASDREKAHLSQHPPMPASAAPGSLTPELVAGLMQRTEGTDAAQELLIHVVDALGKIYAPDLEAYGLTPRDKVLPKHQNSLRQVADRVAVIMGVEQFDLYIHRVRTRGVAVELTSPPSLLVPASVADLPEPQQVFLLARPLLAIAQRLHAIEKLTPRELEVSLASAARNVSPGYGAGLTSEDILDERAKRLHKSLPRRSRKAVEAVASRYVEAPRVDFVRWTEGIQRTSRRLACLLSDDLPSCVELLQRMERELGGLHGPALVKGSPAVADLVRYWVSADAMTVRQTLGMLDNE